MFKPDNIISELKELSPVVANIGRVNVFKVPIGYFDTLSTYILLLAHTSTIENLQSRDQLFVPENYFDSLANNIMARIKNESFVGVAQETKEISELIAGIGNKNIFSVDNGYFDQLADNIQIKLKPEPVSEAARETAALSKTVAEIGHENVFTVPQNYFESLAEQVNLKIIKPAKLVNINSHFTVFRYAAAAVVTGIMGLSLFMMLNKKNIEVNTSTQTAAVMFDAKQIIKTNSFDKEFADIPDAAIVEFLESKGQDVEAALVASLEDDKNLPDADDYLIDENTLDDVLKTLDLNN
jgi:hypothetical protein